MAFTLMRDSGFPLMVYLVLEEETINVSNWQEAFYARNPHMPAFWAQAKIENRFQPAFVEWIDENIAIRE